MRLALTDLFKARWTDAIHEEWINALLRQDQRFTRAKLERIRALMDAHVRDAKVVGYEGLIDALDLPDPNDRHVLAAAIRCHADAIVTFNAKDFPANRLNAYAIEIIHPDDFVVYQLDMAAGTVCHTLKEQRMALKNPPKNPQEFLAILQKQQLPQTVAALKDYIDVI